MVKYWNMFYRIYSVIVIHPDVHVHVLGTSSLLLFVFSVLLSCLYVFVCFLLHHDFWTTMSVTFLLHEEISDLKKIVSDISEVWYKSTKNVYRTRDTTTPYIWITSCISMEFDKPWTKIRKTKQNNYYWPNLYLGDIL